MIGSFRPKFSLRVALAISSAPEPNMASTGSPGATLNKIKTNDETISKLKGIKDNLKKVYLISLL